MDEFIERRIVTGLVVSTDYIQWAWPHFDLDLIESPELRRIAAWCLEYFDEYRKAPLRNIEVLYMYNLKHGSLPKDEAELRLLGATFGMSPGVKTDLRDIKSQLADLPKIKEMLTQLLVSAGADRTPEQQSVERDR